MQMPFPMNQRHNDRPEGNEVQASAQADPGLPCGKKRYPRALALDVARDLCAALRLVTSRLIVAGSLRRGKSMVGDVEILYIPRSEERPFDMFSTAMVDLSEEAIAELLGNGTISKRLSKTGACSWGIKNKLALHCSGVPVDLFAATEENWWNYLVCRTGPADSNTRICMEAQKRGWKWNPYGPGFTRDGEAAAMGSEEAVFEFVGLPCLRPSDRT